MPRLVLLLLLCTLPGCGSGGISNLAPVSGTVKLDGAPLSGATVTFKPLVSDDEPLAPTSFGKTDDQGRYSLELVTTSQTGAVIGEHRVAITVPEDEEVVTSGDVAPEDLPPRKIPLRYNHESELTFTVPAGGSTAADFDLSGDK